MTPKERIWRRAIRKILRTGIKPTPTAVLRYLDIDITTRMYSGNGGPQLDGTEASWRTDEFTRAGWRKHNGRWHPPAKETT